MTVLTKEYQNLFESSTLVPVLILSMVNTIIMEWISALFDTYPFDGYDSNYTKLKKTPGKYIHD